MTIEEHIRMLMKQSEDDFGACVALSNAGYYAHALFWAHLVLEKLCKALWIFRNQQLQYPYIHNLLRLLKESNQSLDDEQIEFYAEMNQFQSRGRYIDSFQKIESTVTKEMCEKYLAKTKTQQQWLTQLIQL